MSDIAKKKSDPKKPVDTCGIVMPIGEIDGCSEKHWSEVLNIIEGAIELSGLIPRLVSTADDAGIIHKRIIGNLYADPIVVCDVSALNPNVMFELGIRLAFDKPTVLVKDMSTKYSFDTSPLEHLTYPRDLRYPDMVSFGKRLSDKVTNTLKKFKESKNHSPFLESFGKFQTPKIDSEEVNSDKYLANELDALRDQISRQGNYLRSIETFLATNQIRSRSTLFNNQPANAFAVYPRQNSFADELSKIGQGDKLK